MMSCYWEFRMDIEIVWNCLYVLELELETPTMVYSNIKCQSTINQTCVCVK